MVSIIEQPTRKGTHYKVRFRQGSKQRAVSFATRDDAEAWVRVLDAVGPARALDILDEDRAADLAPTEDVPTWVARHITSLSGITTGTRDEYHNLNRLSIAPFFAGRPLHLIDEDAVRRRIQWMHDEQGHSAKTIRNRHSPCRPALKAANKAGSSPAPRRKAPASRAPSSRSSTRT